MSTTLSSIIFATPDPGRLARFWADGLGWQVALDAPGVFSAVRAEDEPTWGAGGTPRLIFARSAAPAGRNRIHLDVASSSAEEQSATVERLLALGASPADIGQRDVPWEVLADPDGNELCVLEPRASYAGRQGIAAVVIRCREPQALASLWSAACGWEPQHDSPDLVSFSHGTAPDLELLRADGELGGPHIAIGVTPIEGADIDVEVARLERAGGRRPVRGSAKDEESMVAGGQAIVDLEGSRVIVLRDGHPRRGGRNGQPHPARP